MRGGSCARAAIRRGTELTAACVRGAAADCELLHADTAHTFTFTVMLAIAMCLDLDIHDIYIYHINIFIYCLDGAVYYNVLKNPHLILAKWLYCLNHWLSVYSLSHALEVGGWLVVKV